MMENLENKIDRFLSNKADPQEAEEVFLYFQEHPELLKNYISTSDLLARSEDGSIPKELTNRIADRLNTYTEGSKKATGIYRLGVRYAAAAAFIGALFLTAFLWRKAESRIQLKYQAGNGIKRNIPSIDSLITIENNSIENKKVYLEDGSEVTLSKETKISFYKPFGRVDRNIELTGNAVFKVAKDTVRSFCVTSRGVTTIAVGTAFRVEPAKRGVRISLYEGKVKVRFQGAAERNGLLMIPGQVLRVDSADFAFHFEERHDKIKPDRTLQLRKNDPSLNGMNLPDDMLVFRKATLGEVFKRIEESFEVKIIYSSSDIESTGRFTGRFKMNESPESMIASICAINDLNYTMNGNTITVTK